MTNFHSDALVFFGATGDLAYKKIFPSLQAMVNEDTSTFPSSASRKPDGIWISFVLARKIVLRNMVVSILQLSKN
jgi:hypothetical protein